MAGNYLGEELVTDLAGTPYEGFGRKEWALEFVGRYGGIDGEHHKTWVIDQVVRILKGTPVILKKASWDAGADIRKIEWRFETGKPSRAYKKWVEEQKGEKDPETGETEYGWEEGWKEGIAP